MKRYTTVLTIAGSDCSGGAGIQADIKTISSLGAYAGSVVTAITAQSSGMGVQQVQPVEAALVQQQLRLCVADLRPHAIKIGMVCNTAIVEAICAELPPPTATPVVLDPVSVSSSGMPLLCADARQALLQRLAPLCTLVTPNIPEAAAWLQRPITTVNDMQAAAQELLQRGCRAVLLKGGHLPGNTMCDVLATTDATTPHIYSAPRVDTRNTHGTGCTLSAAIATLLAQGTPLPQAVAQAKEYLTQALQAGAAVAWAGGSGAGPMNHLFAPRPMRAHVPAQQPPCGADASTVLPHSTEQINIYQSNK